MRAHFVRVKLMVPNVSQRGEALVWWAPTVHGYGTVVALVLRRRGDQAQLLTYFGTLL